MRIGPGRIEVQAEKPLRQGAMLQLSGKVAITTSAMTLRADEADFQTETGDIEARGNVHLHLKWRGNGTNYKRGSN